MTECIFCEAEDAHTTQYGTFCIPCATIVGEIIETHFTPGRRNPAGVIPRYLDRKLGHPFYHESYQQAETFEAPYVGSDALMDIGKNTDLSSFTTSELTKSSAIHGDFDTASLDYSGHQNLEVRCETFGAETGIITAERHSQNSGIPAEEAAWKMFGNPTTILDTTCCCGTICEICDDPETRSVCGKNGMMYDTEQDIITCVSCRESFDAEYNAEEVLLCKKDDCHNERDMSVAWMGLCNPCYEVHQESCKGCREFERSKRENPYPPTDNWKKYNSECTDKDAEDEWSEGRHGTTTYYTTYIPTPELPDIKCKECGDSMYVDSLDYNGDDCEIIYACSCKYVAPTCNECGVGINSWACGSGEGLCPMHSTCQKPKCVESRENLGIASDGKAYPKRDMSIYGRGNAPNKDAECFSAESPSATNPINEPTWVKPVATGLGFILGFFGIKELKKVL